MRRALLLVLLLLLGLAGCHRTRYVGLQRLPPPEHGEMEFDRSPPQYWRNFWIYGWAPGELVIDAAHQCGGTAHVERIETQQSFVQALIQAFAGYYINIYAPYTGRVVCDHSPGPASGEPDA